MKKTRIIKIFRQTNNNDYNAIIIIPVTPFNFTIRSVKNLKEILNESFSTPKKILKKKEIEIIEKISSSTNEIEIRRNFNIIINDDLIKISDFHLVNSIDLIINEESLTQIPNNEKTNIENYLKDFKDRVKYLKISGKITQLIFEYEFTFIKTEDTTP